MQPALSAHWRATALRALLSTSAAPPAVALLKGRGAAAGDAAALLRCLADGSQQTCARISAADAFQR